MKMTHVIFLAGSVLAASAFAANVRYVVPPGTAGNEPASPYANWE